MSCFKGSVLVLPWTYQSIHCLLPGATTSSTSAHALSTRDSRCGPKGKRRTLDGRGYATAAQDSRHDAHHWPTPLSGQLIPTPYQIFAIKQNAPYSKQRFYELVKIYHPDRSKDTDLHLPPAVRLERYRLIVAAHTILSDPVKRRAYDCWGAGWGGKSDTISTGPRSSSTQPGPFSSWREHHDSDIWANATWEDWERWRFRRERSEDGAHTQTPVYAHNGAFISVVATLAFVGGIANYRRADTVGAQFLEARDSVHDRTARDLRRARQDTNLRAKDERIEWFLRNREAAMTGIGAEELREERARHLLPDQDACMSDNESRET